MRRISSGRTARPRVAFAVGGWARAAALLLAAASVGHAGAARAETVVVAELFTSQGCNSCPPADAYLGALADRPDVVALSFHIDYWDHLGWRDPFAKPEHSARQRAYQVAMRKRMVYTPQLVLQGRRELVGSRRDQAEAAIAALKSRPAPATVAAARADGALSVTVAAADAPVAGGGAVWAIGYERRRETAIPRGENAGQTLAYHNVVSQMISVGVWDGAETARYAVPLPDAPAEAYAVIVHAPPPEPDALGPIIGAAKVAAGRSIAPD